MLRYLPVFLIIWLCLNFNAQSPMNNALKMRISDKALAQQFTILVKGNVERLKGNSAGLNYAFNYSAGDIASITTDLNSLSKLIETKIVSRAEFIEATKIPFNDTMVVKNRIIGVKTGTPPLPQAYDGTGVVVGIIDTGTDWRHLDFKDAGGNTRIQYIWEQSVFGGTATPQPYNYGKEWTAAQINANQCTHNDVAGSGHGTHVSGVAVGNGLQTGKMQGVAPKADIVVVALNFNLAGPTIADAVNYIFAKATLMGKPCVINASVGDYNGSHDGTDLEAKLIENMVKNIGGRVMVAAGGNAGTARSHVKTIPPVGDTAWTWLNNTSSYNLFYAV